MSKSEKKTDIWGDEYIQHYDDHGNKAGTSRVEIDIWGDSYEQHRDDDGNKAGYSTNETDVWGDPYEQHRDEDGNKAGYSTNETDMWGDRYEQHREEEGSKTGYTTNETDIWGDRYKQHRDQQNGPRSSPASADGTSNRLNASESRSGEFFYGSELSGVESSKAADSKKGKNGLSDFGAIALIACFFLFFPCVSHIISLIFANNIPSGNLKMWDVTQADSIGFVIPVLNWIWLITSTIVHTISAPFSENSQFFPIWIGHLSSGLLFWRISKF